MKTEFIATYPEAKLQELITNSRWQINHDSSVPEFSHLRTLIEVSPDMKEFLDHDYFFQRRYKLEKDTNFRHPISYGVFFTELGETKEPGYLLYQRTKLAGEDRLHGKKSIGIGGHVDMNEVSALIDIGVNVPSLQDIITACQLRELNEEFAFGYGAVDKNDSLVQIDVSPIQLLINSNNGVDQFHLGAVSFTKLAPVEDVSGTAPINSDTDPLLVDSKEEDNIFLKFATLAELIELRNNGELESWSEILVDRLAYDQQQ